MIEAILFVLNLVFYFRLLRCGYIIDDALVPKKKGKNMLHRFYLRLFAKGYSSPAMEHLLRILVHALNAILVYYAFGKNPVSFTAALLWSLNPINNQGVGWLNGIGYSMSALLVLLMMLLPKWSLVFFLFTFWWHLTAVFAPVLFLFMGHPLISLEVLLLPVIGFITAWKIPFNKVQDNATLVFRLSSSTTVAKSITFSKLRFVVKMYAYYFWLTLWPKRIGLYHTFGYAFGITEEDTKKWSAATPFFYFGIATILMNLFLIIRFWGLPLSFGLLWFIVFIAQFCNLVILHQTVSDRYCYLPSIGLMYALVWSVWQIPLPEIRMVILTIFATFYATKLSFYLPAYKNMEKYTDYNLVEQPDNFAAWNWKGILERQKGRTFSAIYAFALGLRYKPNDFRLNANLAFAMKQLGLYKEAYEYLEKAKAGLPQEVLEVNLKALEEEEKDLLLRMGLSGQGKIIIPK